MEEKMAKKKITVQGNYQYTDATLKDANLFRAFGWLTNFRSEHEGKKGEKLYSIRRDVEIAGDPVIRKAEKDYKKYCGKAQKKMTCRHRWGQFFAILFTVLGIVAGANLLVVGLGIAPDIEFLNILPDMVKGIELPFELPLDATTMFGGAAAAIGVISFIAIFCNKSRFKKRMAQPKRKYAVKYAGFVHNAQKNGNDRLYELKSEKPYLMTKNDRKMSDLGDTMARVMNRGNVDEYD